MLFLDKKAKPVKRYASAVFALLTLATGLALWADVPGAKPDRDVKVESFRPVGTTDRAVNIIIKFSSSLVPPDSLNRPTAVIPIKFTPSIDGLARWTATDVLTVYPGRPLNPATNYSATVKAGGGFVNGNAIGHDQKFNFNTSPLSAKIIRYQAQRARDNNRKARLLFDLDFNYPVSREQLKSALRIEGRKNATASKLPVVWADTTSDGKLLPPQADQYFLATELFDLKDEEQQYQLIIKKDLRCENCGENLNENYTYNMAVPRNPLLDLTISEVRSERAGKQGAIQIQFSSQVPTDEALEHITIEPAVPFTIESHWRGIRLLGDFQPRTTYTVSITPGVTSRDGTLLEKGFSSKVIMGDLNPTVRFTSPGLYLPRDGNKLLEISTINLDTVSIEVSQVFANNLVPYMASGADNRRNSFSANDAFGRGTFIKDFALVSEVNQELFSTVDIGAIIGDTLKGVFLVTVRGKSSRWLQDSRHVMITDIGVMARMSESHLMVWSNSLSDAKPINKARVKLYSRNNQLLLEGKTNLKGVALFTDIAERVDGYLPFLVTIEKDGDLSYLRLDNTRLPTSDFDLSGRPYLSGGYEAFLYLDRGVFRPGEKAHLISLVRGENGLLPKSFPYRLKIVDPRGRLFREFRMNADQAMGTIDLDLPKDIPSGKYKVTALLSDDYILGQTEFLVEEFIPDRIKVAVRTDQPEYQVGDTIQISVNGQMLYGAPAAKLKVNSEIILTPEKFTAEGYSGYSFAVRGGSSSLKRIALGNSLLSDSGTATFKYLIEKDYHPSGNLTAQVWATVSENGGRSVSSFIEARVYQYNKYVGIKTNLESYAEIGKEVKADIVVLQPDGSATTADSIQVTFHRIVYNSMLKKQPDGSYRYVSERTEEPIDSIRVAAGPEKATVSFTPATYGHYRIIAQDGNNGHRAAVEFYASGWGRVPWSLEEPDRLQLDLDQNEYRPGALAKLQVRAPFGGQLLVTVENQTVQDYMVVDLPDNTAMIELPVKREYAPNVYISATLIRPASEIIKSSPARAYGLIPLKVTETDRHLEVTITGPEEIQPNSELILDLQTNGSDQTELTLAAVDVGILQLTNFTTPDPFEFFCGKRRPSLNGYDIYSLIYPETERASSHLSPPGGTSNFREKRHLNPFQVKRVNIVSLWSGVLNTDSLGRAKVKLEVPQFNGRLKIMAVATDGARFGSSSTDLLVRQPIILQESFPRFVAPGDEVEGLVTVFNGLDTTATIQVSAAINGQAELSNLKTEFISLKSGQQGTLIFPFKSSSAPGKINVNLKAQAGSEITQESFELSNRTASSLETLFGSGQVTTDSTVVLTLLDQWVDGTAEYILRTSSLTALRMTRNIEYLLKYPYGCVEQTTSALFPLLYFNDLAKVVRPELFGGRGHEYYIAEGIEKLLRFQQNNGAFTYWPGSEHIHIWSSIYASHFLIEARLAGYEVDDKSYKRLLNFLEDIARNKNFSDISTEHRVYACQALAKAGKLDKKMFNYLTGINSSQLPVYSTYQLASSLALAGDISRAKEIVSFDLQPDLSPPEAGGNFSSGVRTDAILLDLLMDVEPSNPSAAVLVQSLTRRSELGRWYNTQATAFALMAVGKYFSHNDPAAFIGEIEIEKGEKYKIDTADFVLTDDQLGGRKISISIKGKGPCFFYWQASGLPLSPAKAEYERGITIQREYLDATGAQAYFSEIKLGTQLVGHITVKSNGGYLENVVIADLLPAGFEIENQRLANSPLMPWLPRNSDRAQYQDIRDDRVLLFVNIPSNRTLHFYYGLRAIAAGEFAVPPVAAECMYNPLVAGVGSSGRITVTGPQK